MSTSQALWLAGMVSAICTALLGQAELIGEPWRHYITIASVVATAVSGFMLQRPGSQVYFVERGGVVQQVDRAQFEQHAKDSAAQMPQPLPRPIPD